MFEGVYAALMTPFGRDDEILEERLCEHVDFLIDKGIDGLYVCGNSGQGVYMSVPERKRVLELVQARAQGKACIIAHVAALTTRDAHELVLHANEVGADAVASLPPIYWTHSDDEVVGYYDDINEGSSLPCLVYLRSAQGAPDLSIEALQRIAEIPAVVGMKFTSPDFFKMQDLLQRLDWRWTVLSGPDELFLPALTMGVRGSIGTTQNIFPELFTAIFKHFHDRELDKAMAVQQVVTGIVRLYREFGGGIAVAQSLLTLRGLSLAYCRRPLMAQVPEERREALLDRAREVIAGSPVPIELHC